MVNYIKELGTGKFPGLYVINTTKYKSSSKRKNLFKVGMSKDLTRRLDGYFLCFPRGYYIYDLVVLKDSYKWRVKHYEKQLHNMLKQYEIRTPARRKHTEWFSISEPDLKKIVKQFVAVHSRKVARHIFEWDPVHYSK